jgi:hypothetical protein
LGLRGIGFVGTPTPANRTCCPKGWDHQTRGLRPEGRRCGRRQGDPARQLIASVQSHIPLADARGSERLILSRDREGAVLKNRTGWVINCRFPLRLQPGRPSAC